MENGDGLATLIVTVGDSRDARLFVELSSHGADLAEARDALDLAIRGKEQDSSLAGASAFLVGYAVVAYCRTILHSNVRKRLTDYVEVPEELLAIHQQIKTFRNATVAHSQSELSVTYPVGVLDARTLGLRYVAGVTVNSPLPWLVASNFRRLIVAMEERLDEATEPVRLRLERQLRGTDRKSLISAPRPGVLERFAGEFDPKTKRPPYPRSHTVYWDLAEVEVEQNNEPSSS